MADTEKLIQEMLKTDESSGSVGAGAVLVILIVVAVVVGAVVYVMFLSPKKKKKASDKLVLKCKQPICSGPGWSGSVCKTDTCLRNPELTDSDLAYCPQPPEGDLNLWAATSDPETSLYASPVSKDAEAKCTRHSDRSDDSCNIDATIWSDDTPRDQLKNAICKKVDGTDFYAVNCPCDNCEEIFANVRRDQGIFSVPIVMPPNWDFTQQFCCPRAIVTSNEMRGRGSEYCEPCTEKTLGTVCMDGAKSQFICGQPDKFEKKYEWILFHKGYEDDYNIFESDLCAKNKFCSYGRFGNAATCPGFDPGLMDMVVPYAADIKDMNENTRQAFIDSNLRYALK